MIVSRAPVRFSLGGGGTDLPAYSSVHGGYVVSAAIDKYVYVTANKRFFPNIRIAYSKTEIVSSVNNIEHPIFREALRMVHITDSIELTSVADLPSNSGLGSSSSFTVALLNALHTFKREFVSSKQLAEEACYIEMDRLGEPIGKQDQYIAAFGNITAMTFDPDGTVNVEPVSVSDETIAELENNLVILWTGIERPASTILKEQQNHISHNTDDAVKRMHHIKSLGHEVVRILVNGNIDAYGELLHEHWMQKRKLANKMTESTLDEHYDVAIQSGAIGGKLMGAGGGGFFMFYVPPSHRRRFMETMMQRGLRPLRFRFDLDGARIVANMHRT